jgi:hypothetical protein
MDGKSLAVLCSINFIFSRIKAYKVYCFLSNLIVLKEEEKPFQQHFKSRMRGNVYNLRVTSETVLLKLFSS